MYRYILIFCIVWSEIFAAGDESDVLELEKLEKEFFIVKNKEKDNHQENLPWLINGYDFGMDENSGLPILIPRYEDQEGKPPSKEAIAAYLMKQKEKK